MATPIDPPVACPKCSSVTRSTRFSTGHDTLCGHRWHDDDGRPPVRCPACNSTDPGMRYGDVCVDPFHRGAFNEPDEVDDGYGARRDALTAAVNLRRSGNTGVSSADRVIDDARAFALYLAGDDDG